MPLYFVTRLFGPFLACNIYYVFPFPLFGMFDLPFLVLFFISLGSYGLKPIRGFALEGKTPFSEGLPLGPAHEDFFAVKGLL